MSGDDQKPNGVFTRNIHFSSEQAYLAKQLLQGVNQSRNVYIEAQSKWEAFLVGIGMSFGDEIVGGDLDTEEPTGRKLMVRSGNGISHD